MKIVTLTTFPFSHPRHGGQQRMRSLVEAYERDGHVVRSVGVLGSSIYAHEEGFLPLPEPDELTSKIPNPFLMEDWAIGRLAAEDDNWFARLATAVGDPPDLFHIEHPWLFGFAQRYRDTVGKGKPTLLYGSANIEHRLKKTIVEGYLGEDHAEACGRLVLDTELAAVRESDLTCAVSEGDAAWLLEHGAPSVVLAANGVRDRIETLTGIQHANRLVGHRRYALYCASGHPPNIVGFYDMLGDGVGCISPQERIVVAGGAGRAVLSDPRFLQVPGLARQFIDAGEVEEDVLQGLIHCAHLMLLPITQGGGTNLKTAEAIWSGHRIVATPTAMRGFETFNDATGIAIAAGPIPFRHAIRDQMAREPLVLTPSERAAREVVTWESTLQPLIDQVRLLAGEPT